VLFPGIDDGFERGLLFEDSLSLFAVVPEIRLRGDLVQLGDAFLLSLKVKDASAIARVVLPGGSVVLWFLPTFLSFPAAFLR
jgi:hypothetical protein